MTAAALQSIEQELAHRERRQFRATVLWGFSIFFLVVGVPHSIYSDFRQDSDIRAVGICASAPDSKECAENHAISVSKTTPAEACFILAQGGVKCQRPLRNAPEYQKRLLKGTSAAGTVTYESSVAASSPDAEPPVASAPDLDGPQRCCPRSRRQAATPTMNCRASAPSQLEVAPGPGSWLPQPTWAVAVPPVCLYQPQGSRRERRERSRGFR